MNLLQWLQPISLGTLQVRNRLVCTTSQANFNVTRECPDPHPGAGAYGLCLLEAGSVHPSSHVEPALFEERQQRTLNAIADRAHADCMRVIQCLTHAGNQRPAFNGAAPWSASNKPGPTGISGKAMGASEILQIRLAFVSAALMCQESGLDGVEIAITQGNLMQQFLRTDWNDRKDQYSAQQENRCRFLLETARAVRAAVGSDFIIGISLDDCSAQLARNDNGYDGFLNQLTSERLLDFIRIHSAAAPAQRLAVELPQIVEVPKLSLRSASSLLNDGHADLVVHATALPD